MVTFTDFKQCKMAFIDLNQPLLLAESTTKAIPALLEDFIKKCDLSGFSSSQDCRISILAALIYYVTLESGFIPFESEQFDVDPQSMKPNSRITVSSNDNDSESSCAKRQKGLGQIKFGFNINHIRNFSQIPANFKRQTNFRVNLHLENSQVKCVMLMMRSGEGLLTTLTSEPYPGGSVLLSASRFVPYINKQNLASSFRNLSELSTMVKDKLCTPTMNQILSDNNQIFPGLLGLPPELDNIIVLLSASGKKSYALTCRKLNEEVRSYLRRRSKKRV